VQCLVLLILSPPLPCVCRGNEHYAPQVHSADENCRCKTEVHRSGVEWRVHLSTIPVGPPHNTPHLSSVAEANVAEVQGPLMASDPLFVTHHTWCRRWQLHIRQ